MSIMEGAPKTHEHPGVVLSGVDRALLSRASLSPAALAEKSEQQIVASCEHRQRSPVTQVDSFGSHSTRPAVTNPECGASVTYSDADCAIRGLCSKAAECAHERGIAAALAGVVHDEITNATPRGAPIG